MQGRSEQEIKRFTEYREKYISGKWRGDLSEKERLQLYYERLSGYLCSLSLGRDFSETVESYFQRKGLTEFDSWASLELSRLFPVTCTQGVKV